MAEPAWDGVLILYDHIGIFDMLSLIWDCSLMMSGTKRGRGGLVKSDFGSLGGGGITQKVILHDEGGRVWKNSDIL